MPLTSIGIRCVGGVFDVARVQEFVLAQPYAARDAYEPTRLIVSYSPDSVDWIVQERQKDPSEFPRTGVLIITLPDGIHIGGWIEGMAVARGLVHWLRAHHDLRFFDDDYGGEVTAHVDEGLNFLFGEAS